MSKETDAAKGDKITEEVVREALREALDPELNIDVVSMGLIKTVNLESEPAEIKMVLTTPFCPYGPWLVQQVKDAAEKASQREVEVEILAEQWTPEMMEDPTLFGFF